MTVHVALVQLMYQVNVVDC